MSDKQSKKEQEEKLYTDSKNVKCNLRGMMRREPEWLLSRFRFMEQRIEELDRQVKYRYCSKCETQVPCHEVDHFGFHTCGRFTVPLYSEERRRRFMAEKRIDQLTAEKEKISKLAAVCMVYKKFYSHVRECVDQSCGADSPVKCKVCDQTFHEITGIRERIVSDQLPGAGKLIASGDNTEGPDWRQLRQDINLRIDCLEAVWNDLDDPFTNCIKDQLIIPAITKLGEFCGMVNVHESEEK